MNKSFSNIIIVSGSGKNSGKTSLVCKLIKKFRDFNCIAVKISSHFHELPESSVFLKKTSSYDIVKEHIKSDKKDSQKMYASGADPVYYVQSKDKYLEEIAGYLNFDNQTPVFIESGGMSKIIPDCMHICMNGNKDKKCMNSDIELNFNQIDSFVKNLNFENNRFILND